MEKVVLIVEDDTQNRKLFRDLLGVKGYTTLEATNGKEGVEMAKTAKPHLILMDIQMPVMDGLKAFEILKKDPETRDIPVVALTSYAMKGDRERLLEAGFAAYISKPIDTREFLKKVAQYV